MLVSFCTFCFVWFRFAKSALNAPFVDTPRSLVSFCQTHIPLVPAEALRHVHICERIRACRLALGRAVPQRSLPPCGGGNRAARTFATRAMCLWTIGMN